MQQGQIDINGCEIAQFDLVNPTNADISINLFNSDTLVDVPTSPDRFNYQNLLGNNYDIYSPSDYNTTFEYFDNSRGVLFLYRKNGGRISVCSWYSDLGVLLDVVSYLHSYCAEMYKQNGAYDEINQVFYYINVNDEIVKIERSGVISKVYSQYSTNNASLTFDVENNRLYFISDIYLKFINTTTFVISSEQLRLGDMSLLYAIGSLGLLIVFRRDQDLISIYSLSDLASNPINYVISISNIETIAYSLPRSTDFDCITFNSAANDLLFTNNGYNSDMAALNLDSFQMSVKWVSENSHSRIVYSISENVLVAASLGIDLNVRISILNSLSYFVENHFSSSFDYSTLGYISTNVLMYDETNKRALYNDIENNRKFIYTQLLQSFYISSPSNYKQFVRGISSCPKEVCKIGLYAPQSSFLNPLILQYKDANGKEFLNPYLPNVNIPAMQYDGNIVELEFERNQLVLDGSVNLFQYIIPANTTIRMLLYYKEMCKSAKLSSEVQVSTYNPEEMVYWMPKNIIVSNLVKEGYYPDGWESLYSTEESDRKSWLKKYKSPFGVCKNTHGSILVSDMVDDGVYPSNWETMKPKVNIGKHANEDTDLMNDVYDIGCSWLPQTILVNRMAERNYYPKIWRTIKEKIETNK